MNSDQLSFVSVVFDVEYPLLLIQARSIAKFMPTSLVADVVVIDNSARGMTPAQTTQLLSDYGWLAPQVRILRPDAIVRVRSADGWRSQQVLKLCIANQITTEKYVVLDAKNHFVNPVQSSFFVARDGRARVNAHDYATHPLRANLEHVLRYLDIDPAPFVDNFTATITPFVLDSAIVRDLMHDIEKRSGNAFAREFVAKDLTEFFLYTAWIIASDIPLERVYDLHQATSPVVWPRGANVEGVREAIDSARASASPVFSIHRRALAALDEASSALVAEWWSDRGLFVSTVEASAFITKFQNAYAREARRQRLRDLPKKLIGLPRLVRRRREQAAVGSPARR